MEQHDFNFIFEYEVLPYIAKEYETDGIADQPARREAYNNLMDSFCKDGTITEDQYNEWVMPNYLETVRPRSLKE